MVAYAHMPVIFCRTMLTDALQCCARCRLDVVRLEGLGMSFLCSSLPEVRRAGLDVLFTVRELHGKLLSAGARSNPATPVTPLPPITNFSTPGEDWCICSRSALSVFSLRLTTLHAVSPRQVFWSDCLPKLRIEGKLASCAVLTVIRCKPQQGMPAHELVLPHVLQAAAVQSGKLTWTTHT